MPRLVGVNIPENKRLEVALTYIHGIGRATAQKILTQTKIDLSLRAKDLSAEQVKKLTELLNRHTIEGELRKQVRDNIERLKRSGAYRGLRHSMRLPVRGQRTRTNARSRKGARRTVGAMTKEARQKVGSAK